MKLCIALTIIAAMPLTAQVPDTAIYQLSRPPITAADRERLRNGVQVPPTPGKLTRADSAAIKAIAALREPGRDTTIAPKIEVLDGTVQVVVMNPNGNTRYWASRSVKPPGWELSRSSVVTMYRPRGLMPPGPLAAQSSTPSPPNDTAAIEAVVEDSGRKAVGVRIVADTAWVRVVDRRAPADISSDGKTTSGTALRSSEIRVERRRGRWTVSKPKP